MNKSTRGAILIITAGILWGAMGIFVRMLSKYDLDGTEIGVIRLVITLLGTLILTFAVNKKLFRINPRDIWIFAGAGICGLTGSTVLYFYSIQMTSMSVAAITLYTAPVIVMILSAVIFRIRITPVKVVACLLAVAGCAFVSGIIGGDIVGSPAGVLLGLGSGLAYALYSIFTTFAVKRGYESLTVMIYAFTFAAALTITICASGGGLPALGMKIVSNPIILLIGTAMALLTCLAPYAVYNTGLKYIETSRASIMATVEPVMATVWGLICFGEQIKWFGYVGIILVVAAIVMLNIKKDSPTVEQKTKNEKSPEYKH